MLRAHRQLGCGRALPLERAPGQLHWRRAEDGLRVLHVRAPASGRVDLPPVQCGLGGDARQLPLPHVREVRYIIIELVKIPSKSRVF